MAAYALAPFVLLVLHSLPAAQAQVSCDDIFNPCSAGNCQAAGSGYSCSCSANAKSAKRADGHATCTTGIQCSEVYTSKSTDETYDTCDTILQNKPQVGSIENLYMLNPGLDCNGGDGTFDGGVRICVAQGSSPPCSQYAKVAVGSSCKSIATAAGLTLEVLFNLNPGLQCEDTPFLLVGENVCIKAGSSPIPPSSPSTGPPLTSPPSTGPPSTGPPSTGSDPCQEVCLSRAGETSPGLNGCPAGHYCPYPQFNTSRLKEAKKKFPKAKKPLCVLYKAECKQACSLLQKRHEQEQGTTTGLVGLYKNCFNLCFGCASMPCRGPSATWTYEAPQNPCTKASSKACTKLKKGPGGTLVQKTKCTFWNKVRKVSA